MKGTLVFIRQLAYTIFTLVYYVGLGIDMSIRGFFLLTLGGKTPENKYKYHSILQRKAEFVINHVPGTTFSYINDFLVLFPFAFYFLLFFSFFFFIGFSFYPFLFY